MNKMHKKRMKYFFQSPVLNTTMGNGSHVLPSFYPTAPSTRSLKYHDISGAVKWISGKLGRSIQTWLTFSTVNALKYFHPKTRGRHPSRQSHSVFFPYQSRLLHPTRFPPKALTSSARVLDAVSEHVKKNTGPVESQRRKYPRWCVNQMVMKKWDECQDAVIEF